MDLRRDEKSLSTAFQKMDVTSMTENRDAGFVNMLQGKVAGLQVISNGAAGSATVRIRGANSISGNNQPLYVIDGVPIINNVKDGEIDYGNPANNINSDDIESIVVRWCGQEHRAGLSLLGGHHHGQHYRGCGRCDT